MGDSYLFPGMTDADFRPAVSPSMSAVLARVALVSDDAIARAVATSIQDIGILNINEWWKGTSESFGRMARDELVSNPSEFEGLLSIVDANVKDLAVDMKAVGLLRAAAVRAVLARRA